VCVGYRADSLFFLFLWFFFFSFFFGCFLSPFYPRFPAIRIQIQIRMYISHRIPLVLISILISFPSYFHTNQPITSANQPTPHNPSSQFTVRHRYCHLTFSFFHFFVPFTSPIPKISILVRFFSDPFVVSVICTTCVCMMYEGNIIL
jgi:hypothetical protein